MSGVSFDRILDKISSELDDSLVFAGALDNNAKLLSFRKGTGKFSLPVERHDTLDVQISLLFSLLRQLEDISGNHRFTLTRFEKYDFCLFGTNDVHMFAVVATEPDERSVQAVANIARGIELPDFPVPKPKEPIPVTPVASSRTSRESSKTERHTQSASASRKLKPDPIIMLQGFLMGIESGLVIEEDDEGYKIKSNQDGRISWNLMQRISSTFADKVELSDIEKDADGQIVIRVAPRE